MHYYQQETGTRRSVLVVEQSTITMGMNEIAVTSAFDQRQISRKKKKTDTPRKKEEDRKKN